MPYPQTLILFDEIFESLTPEMVRSKLAKSNDGGKGNSTSANSARIPCKYGIKMP